MDYADLAIQNFYGSSSLAAYNFSMEVFIKLLKDDTLMDEVLQDSTILPKVDTTNIKAGDSIRGLQTMLNTYPEMLRTMKQQVLDRCAAHHRRFTPPEFVEENSLQWSEANRALQSKIESTDTKAHLEYPFVSLIGALKQEWQDSELTIGNLNSLPLDVQSKLNAWLCEF